MDTKTNNDIWNKIETSSTNNTSANSTISTTIESSTSQKASVVTQSIVGAATGATVVFSMCNLSTPQGVWITMNQFQLILLLLLTNSQIPQSVVDYLSGLKATTWSLNFVPFKDIPGVKTITDWLDFGLENSDLKHFGLLSGSTFVNNFSLIWVVALIAAVHLWFNLCHSKLKRKTSDRPKWRSLLSKVYQTFAFTIYLRLVLESNQFLLLSSFSELKTWHITGTVRIVSLWTAFAAASVCVSLIAVSFVHWLFHRQLENTDHYMPLKELFGGLKDRSKPRLYSIVLLTRRCFLVAFLVAGSSLTSTAIVVPMLVVQTVYVSLMTALRPYKSAKDNLLEVVNEVYYFVMIAMLVHYNSDSKWSKAADTAYLWLIFSNSLTIIFIMISNKYNMTFIF